MKSLKEESHSAFWIFVVEMMNGFNETSSSLFFLLPKRWLSCHFAVLADPVADYSYRVFPFSVV